MLWEANIFEQELPPAPPPSPVGWVQSGGRCIIVHGFEYWGLGITVIVLRIYATTSDVGSMVGTLFVVPFCRSCFPFFHQ